MRIRKRGLALLLSMVIVMTSTVPANMAEAVSSESTVALKEEKVVNEILKKEELKEERTEYSTTYEMPDGTTQVENYALLIRYRDQKTKELVDYDASLMGIHSSDRLASGNKLTGYQYQNKSGDKKNYFPETLNKDTPIITEYDGYQISIHDENGSWQMIFGVMTLPEYQGKGYAAKLMEQVIEDCRMQGKKGIVLTCKNELIKFYEQFGYINEGQSMSKHGGVSWDEMRLTYEQI